jgi:alginate O-acetyltransferase complex protein AlgI
MLFTTSTFALLFLPITLIGFFVIGRLAHSGAAAWLLLASLVFYGYWMPEFTLLLVASIAANFHVGLRIQQARTRSSAAARRWMIFGIALDLGLLAYFKYAHFFVGNLEALLGAHWDIGQIILPIGISFYTFTQIAFLVDAYQGKVGEARWIHYGLFVTYFPHLIAGPVLHHAQMMPQFADRAVYRFQMANFAGGMFIFAMGLFKKIVLADGVAPYADAVFDPVGQGAVTSPSEAWLAAVAYTLQLYFDFSGYSDMAIGLSWMFNIRLPFNFNSPYRATSISEFWRRWHITLSNFLRDYLYVPLGGNRSGAARRYLNLSVTMLLGGLWHGASWTFVFWGGLHGLYLMINHGFRAMVGAERSTALERSRVFRAFGWGLTMLSVVVAWVFFRATSFAGAWSMLTAMAGAGASADAGLQLWNAGLKPATGLVWCAVLGVLVVALPNSNDIGTHVLRVLRRDEAKRYVVCGFATTAAALLVLINTARDSVSAFIYFNF